MSNLICYLRVSTQKQKVSGLGLEAQKGIIEHYRSSGNHNVLSEYEEIETGRNSQRPVLAEAIAHAKRAGATLVIAKLDRLARNVQFISTLMNAGVDFVACDMPSANRFVLHIYAAIAEEEARMIRERTRAALAAKKAQGKKLGAANPKIAAALEGKRGWKKASIAALDVRARLHRERYEPIIPLVKTLRERGETFQAIATTLNEQGYRTMSGREFHKGQVSRVYQKASLTS